MLKSVACRSAKLVARLSCISDCRTGLALTALLICAAYYLAALFSFTLRVPSTRSSIIWAPNAILLTVFLLTPVRRWWLWALAATPAHLLAQSRDGAQLLVLLCPFIANVAQASIAALGLRCFTDPPYGLNRLKDMAIFIIVAVIAAPALVSFTAAWLFVVAGWESDYRLAAQARFHNNITTGLTVAPLCLAVVAGDVSRLLRMQARRYAEISTVYIGLAAVLSISSFWHTTEAISLPMRLYAPLLFLLWAAVRFGPAVLAIALLMVAYDSISDSIAGHGLFSAGSPAANVLMLEASLGVLALPLMLISALMQEREQREDALRESEARYRALVTASSDLVWRANPSGEGLFVTPAWEELTGQGIEQSRNFGWLQAVHPDDRERCKRLWKQAMECRRVYENELRVRSLDESYRHFYIHAVPILAPNGEVREWIGAASDITDRKRAEQVLRESEARFRNMAEFAPVMIWITNSNGSCTYLNQRYTDFTGTTLDQGLGFGWLDSVHEEDRKRTTDTFLRANERHEGFRVEYHMRCWNGEYRWVIDSASPRFSDDGQFLGYIGSIIDITERKRAEQALRDSQERLHLALEAGGMGIWDWDRRTNALEWSRQYYSIMDMAPEISSPTYETWVERVHPDDLPAVRAAMTRAIAERAHFRSEYRILLDNGATRWVTSRGVPIYDADDECVRVMGVAVDITERKRTESRLNIQYHITRILSESASLADAAAALIRSICDCCDWNYGELWHVAPGAKWLSLLNAYAPSENFASFVSASREFTFEPGIGLTGRVWESGSPAWITNISDDNNSPRAALAEKAGLKSAFAFPISRGERTFAVMAFFSEQIREADPALLQIIGSIGGQIGQFVERKQAENALHAIEERSRAILESALDSIITVDHRGTVIEFNAAAEKTFGYKRTYAIGKQVADLIVPPGLRDKHYRSMARFMANDAAETLGKQVETIAMRSDGTEIPIELAMTRIRLEGPPTFSGYIRDITRRKQAEEALRQAVLEVQRLKERVEADNRYLREELSEAHRDGEIVGSGEPIKKVLRQVAQVAVTDMTVLILGETGTGKELIARAIHASSARKQRPLVKVNCSALPAELMESELFGHEKGAFTGAATKRIGRFELADGGTIFLDEIGDLALSLQAKLLRVLQEGEFERLGSSKTLRVNVRVITATNRDLSDAMRKEVFRSDLYYRLAVYPITIPPLRERKEDIRLLAAWFLAEASRRLGRVFEAIPRPVLDALQRYDWPGNVRELQNVIERAAVTSSGRFLRLPEEWHPQPQTVESVLPQGNNVFDSSSSVAAFTLESLERAHILQVLNQTRWRIEGPRGAAVILGLHPSTLRSRMNKLRISRAESMEI